MCAKLYAFNSLQGCVQQRTARSTKTLVGVYNGPQSGMETEDTDNPWLTVCEPHGYLVGHPTLNTAITNASRPETWCEVCQSDHTP